MPLSLSSALTGEGYHVEAVDAQADPVMRCLRQRPDVIVLVESGDEPPGVSLAICQSLRAHSIGTPCLMVTPAEGAAAAALRCGADDCVASRADLTEILARVEALLRRSRRAAESTLRFGQIVIDLRRRQAATPRGPVDLAPKELALLSYLAARTGSIVPRDELLREVWSYSVLDTRTVDTHMASLRRKIEDDPRRPTHLLTIRGRGYQFLY